MSSAACTVDSLNKSCHVKRSAMCNCFVHILLSDIIRSEIILRIFELAVFNLNITFKSAKPKLVSLRYRLDQFSSVSISHNGVNIIILLNYSDSTCLVKSFIEQSTDALIPLICCPTRECKKAKTVEQRVTIYTSTIYVYTIFISKSRVHLIIYKCWGLKKHKGSVL